MTVTSSPFPEFSETKAKCLRFCLAKSRLFSKVEEKWRKYVLSTSNKHALSLEFMSRTVLSTGIQR